MRNKFVVEITSSKSLDQVMFLLLHILQRKGWTVWHIYEQTDQHEPWMKPAGKIIDFYAPEYVSKIVNDKLDGLFYLPLRIEVRAGEKTILTAIKPTFLGSVNSKLKKEYLDVLGKEIEGVMQKAT